MLPYPMIDPVAIRLGPVDIRKTINARTAAKVFFGALDEMATNWVLSRRKYALEAQADEIVDLLLGGLAGPAKG